MKIASADFVASYTALSQLPKRRLPEIAFAGRSNVGKSSLINYLLGRKNLAKTSNTPGKTRQLNYFIINDQYYFVDLPGYGFAKVAQSERESWRVLIEKYLTASEDLHVVVCLIDARHGPTESDMTLLEWLIAEGIPALVVATKVDKLTAGERQQAELRITKAIERSPVSGPIFFSSRTGVGKRELWYNIEQFLE